MSFVTDPYSGLKLYELSHKWGHGVPSYPGQDDVKMVRAVKHAQHGVLAWRINTVMHTGTHMNAPRHMIQSGADLSQIPEDRFFGNGVVLSIPRGSYETVTAQDLEAASPEVKKNDIVVIVTGWHHKYSDSLEYFGESPGLTKDAAQWLVNKEVKMVMVDTQQIDHPLATSLGPHRGGPAMKRLAAEYQRSTGKDPAIEHGEWNIAHRILLGANIPTVEQVGGEVDDLLGKRVTLGAMPWRFRHGDACPVRVVAICDSKGDYRIPSGKEDDQLSPTGTGLEVCNLSHIFDQFMPEWPSTPSVNISVNKFHAKDGIYEVKWEGIMHRCTHMDAPVHVTENTPSINDYPLWRLCGTGVAVSIPKGKWGVITAEDLENARPKIQEGDIVMINTGFHHKWADTDEYFAYGCGIYREGAQWLVDKKVKLVGYGHQANDHPIATKLVDHGLGPTQPHLIDEWKKEYGRDPKEDFPDWEAGHKTLMVKGGVPGIENIGGDLDRITGKRCFFMAFPWRWPGGDGSIVRVLAIVDPEQKFRFEKGA